MRSAGRGRFAGSGQVEADRSFGQPDPADLVRCGGPIRDAPGPAAGPVVPPLTLDAGDVAAEVVVGVEVPLGRLCLRPWDDLAAEDEVGDLPRATVRTGEEEGHGGTTRLGSTVRGHTRQIGSK